MRDNAIRLSDVNQYNLHTPLIFTRFDDRVYIKRCFPKQWHTSAFLNYLRRKIIFAIDISKSFSIQNFAKNIIYTFVSYQITRVINFQVTIHTNMFLKRFWKGICALTIYYRRYKFWICWWHAKFVKTLYLQNMGETLYVYIWRRYNHRGKTRFWNNLLYGSYVIKSVWFLN